MAIAETNFAIVGQTLRIIGCIEGQTLGWARQQRYQTAYRTGLAAENSILCVYISRRKLQLSAVHCTCMSVLPLAQQHTMIINSNRVCALIDYTNKHMLVDAISTQSTAVSLAVAV